MVYAMKNTCLLSAVPLSSDGERRTFTGLAYSGGPVSAFGSDLVVDLEGVSFADRMPVLVDHDPGKRVGFGSLTRTDNGLEIQGQLLRNALAKELAGDADDGFPWQMSIRVDAGSVEYFKAGEVVNVNGADYQGPVNVFRRNSISEVSFVPLGADSTTYAQVFARGQHEGNEMQELIDQVAALTAALAEMTTRAETAEAAMAEAKLAKRHDAAVALLSAMGDEPTDEAVAAYVAMDDAVFAAVEAQTRVLLAKRPALPPALFTGEGMAVGSDNPLVADAKRRAK